ncbi:ABC transporter C-terminal domain-containing protein [Stigmatella erecta]|uniref:Copper-binding protein MbnP-like domain-containing protein n=1 Tax=Stigmatella erecta TaxID=83460 RepID=A0A1I0KG21_9BACT|nr:ABC transporter C-terminal domain-containing protein [Stigmatella erecta]SEU23265.1 hypothetical protein SAMN05443639_110226 [Stigmatella erecta]
MTISFMASPFRSGRALLLAALTFAALPGCGDDASDPTTLSAEERQQFEQRISELEASVAALEAQLAKDATASEREKQALTTQIGTLQEELAEARALLASQDWDGVLVKLDAARAEIASLQGRMANFAGQVQLTAALRFGGQPFALDQSYTLASGEKITFTELRYWLSNVKFVREDGTGVAIPASYYLMEHIKEQDVAEASQPNDPTAPRVTLPANRREQVSAITVPAGTYTSIEFSVGVDPYYNDNLSRQAGELHLFKNMASVTWMWFTSYIFTKTKGTFTAADGSTGTFAWDTGTNSNFRTTRLAFPSPVTVNAQKHLKVALNAEVSKLFETLSPSAMPTIGAAHAAPRETLSTGFKNMFSMVSAENALQW